VNADVPTFLYPPLGVTNSSGDSLLFVGMPAGLMPRTDSSNTLGSFALASGAVPPGLALDSASGLVSGVPTTVSPAASFEVEATVTRLGVGTRARARASYEIRLPGRWLYPASNSVRVDATFNTISPIWVADPDVSGPISVSAAFAPKAGSCTLPAGVTSRHDGWIDGHPTQTGTFQCTYSVTYSANGVQWPGEAILNLEVQ
jgi:large repetitive protein